MTDSQRIAAIVAGLIVPLLAMAVVIGSTILLVAVIALALVALFVAGLAIGRDRSHPKRPASPG